MRERGWLIDRHTIEEVYASGMVASKGENRNEISAIRLIKKRKEVIYRRVSERFSHPSPLMISGTRLSIDLDFSGGDEYSSSTRLRPNEAAIAAASSVSSSSSSNVGSSKAAVRQVTQSVEKPSQHNYKIIRRQTTTTITEQLNSQIIGNRTSLIVTQCVHSRTWSSELSIRASIANIPVTSALTSNGTTKLRCLAGNVVYRLLWNRRCGCETL